MLNRKLITIGALLGASLLGAASCAELKVDDNETADNFAPSDPAQSPTIRFDPSNSFIPFPNQLLISPTTHKVTLPAPACPESGTATALRTQVLNALDGFGTFQVASSVAVDAEDSDGNAVGADNDTLISGQTVVLYRRSPSPDNTPIPVTAFASTTVRLVSPGCDAGTAVLDHTIVVVPNQPLDPNAHYVAAILKGVTSTEGAEFSPTVPFFFVRQATDPTPTTPSLPSAFSQLWLGMNAPISFLANIYDRSDILVAWEFTTQTTRAPLMPSVAMSPAAQVVSTITGLTDPLDTVSSIAGGDGQAYMTAALGGAPACAAVQCQNVDDVLQGTLHTLSFQLPLNLGGSFSSPTAPAVTDADNPIPVQAYIPAGMAPMTGWPTVIFGHGVTRSKEDAVAIASQLATAGIATVAMSWPLHGDRAVQNSTSALLGCDGTPDPVTDAQCFVPFLSSNLAATRDNFRQADLDILALVEALKRCDNDACGALNVDQNKIGYMGQSLGGIIGSVVAGVNTDISAYVLNVAGVGLLDVIVETDQHEFLQCPLINSLISAGIIIGMPNVTCLDPNLWKNQPGFRQFRGIAQWVLDPADGANYITHRTAPALLQEVIGDDTVPNESSLTLGALLGISAPTASGTSGMPAPSMTFSGAATSSYWVTYTTSSMTHVYDHGSLLAPPALTPQGLLATKQMQTDAITFLGLNL